MVPHANGDGPVFTATADDEYTIPDICLGARRPIRVICIGFGASGINVARVIGQQVPNSNISLQIYEKNPELGGTWYENK